MIVNFDKLNRFEQPTITLCNPNSKIEDVTIGNKLTEIVGILTDISDIELVLNFNVILF